MNKINYRQKAKSAFSLLMIICMVAGMFTSLIPQPVQAETIVIAGGSDTYYATHSATINCTWSNLVQIDRDNGAGQTIYGHAIWTPQNATHTLGPVIQWYSSSGNAISDPGGSKSGPTVMGTFSSSSSIPPSGNPTYGAGYFSIGSTHSNTFPGGSGTAGYSGYTIGGSQAISAWSGGYSVPATTVSVTWTGGSGVLTDSQMSTSLGSVVASGVVVCQYTVTIPPSSTVYNPVITANPNLIKNLGDSVNWTEGITARWGCTTTNLIPTMGTITDNSISGSPLTDTTLSTNGMTYNRVGQSSHSYTVRDSSGDAANTATTRSISVRSATAPTMSIVYDTSAINPFDGTPLTGAYNGEWTNQPLEITISSSDAGAYLLMLRKGGVNTAYSQSVTGPNSYTFTYHDASGGVVGDDLSAILIASDLSTELSPASASQNVKIDLTNPVPGVSYSSGVFTDTSTDTLSGIYSLMNKIALVTTGSPAPLIGDYVNLSLLGGIYPDYYDVYIWAWDNAGNSNRSLALPNVKILSSYSPGIEGKLGPSFTANLPSNTWSNEDVKVIATPDLMNVTGFYTAIYNGTVQEAKSSAIDLTAEVTYSSETAGITLVARLVDSLDVPQSSDSTSYIVKIDKTDPTGALTYNAGTPDYGFTDASTDTASITANSGINNTSVSIVAAGSPEPAAGTYIDIGNPLAEIPSTGHYDVWVITTDVAGNSNTPVKGLININRALTDSIYAKSFSWDIASGSAALTNDVAIMLAHVTGFNYGTGTEYNAGDFLVNNTELVAIQSAISAGQKGTAWPLTFSTPAGPTQANTTVTVMLFDKGPTSGIDTPTPLTPTGPLSHELIYANDFGWAIPAGLISDADALFLSGTTAYDVNGDPISTSLLTVDLSELSNINGAITAGRKGTVWPLTFYTPDFTNTTINVYLHDKGEPPAPGKEGIVASDFSWSVNGSIPISNADALFLSGVRATGEDGFTDITGTVVVDPAGTELTAINAAISAGQSGTTWPLTFDTAGSYGTSTSVTINVSLYDDGGPIPPIPGSEMIFANNFSWSVNGSIPISNADALFLSGVNAKGGDGFTNITSTVIVDPAGTELTAINAAIVAGQSGTTWPLTFDTAGLNGTAASVTIYVSLYDDGGPIPPIPGSETIFANNFSWSVNGSIPISNADALFLSGVSAKGGDGFTNITSTVIVDPAGTELTAINAAIAAGQSGTTWPLTFDTDGLSGTFASVTIYVSLYDDGGPVPPIPGSETIFANNFSWSVNGSVPISNADALFLSGVSAKGGDGFTNITSTVIVDPTGTELTVINAAIAAGQSGTTWPLTFDTDGLSGTFASVTIYVSLYDKGGPVPPTSGDETIFANNFSWSVNGSIPILNADALLLSGVSAKGGDGFTNITSTVIVDPTGTELTVINAAIAAGQSGTKWPLTFDTAGSYGTVASVTIYVSLYDSGGPIPPVLGDETIFANNFGWAIPAGPISNSDALFLSGVSAKGGDGFTNITSTVIVDPTGTEISDINDAIAAGLNGTVWPLTFDTDGLSGTAASITINVLVYDKGGPLPPTRGNESIVANDFGWAIPAGLVSVPDTLFLSGVLAKGADGFMNITGTVVVDPTGTEIAAINDAINGSRTGTVWPLTFETDGLSGPLASVTINVSLYDNGGPLPPTPGLESIVANNFTWVVTAGSLDDNTSKNRSKVIATDANGRRMNINTVLVDPTELFDINTAIAAKQINTTWPLTFETDGTTGPVANVTIIVTLAASPGSGTGYGNATVNNGSNSTTSVPNNTGNQSPGIPEQPREAEPPVVSKGNWSLISVLLLVLSMLLVVADAQRIYKARQLKEDQKISIKAAKSILMFQAMVIVAAFVLVVAFFLLNEVTGNMTFFILKNDVILAAIFVVEAAFFWLAYDKMRKAM